MACHDVRWYHSDFDHFLMVFGGYSTGMVVLSTVLILSLTPLARGVPGEGPDGHAPWNIDGVGPVSVRIRGVSQF